MTIINISFSLNLISSSRIYLLEPQWNPSIEAQAIGRALRLGQMSNVTIVRYIMEGTVEEVCYYKELLVMYDLTKYRAMCYRDNGRSFNLQGVGSR